MPSQTRYNAVAIAIHWLTAIAIAAQFAVGWYMISLRPPSYLHFALHQWHKSIGMTILALSIVRLLWRLTHRAPPLPAAMPAWERRAAKFSHVMLYVMLIALPVSGWAVVSASPLNIPTKLYGIIPVPHLPVLSELRTRRQRRKRRRLCTRSAAGSSRLAGHIGAALRHHFWYRDDLLARMLPGR